MQIEQYQLHLAELSSQAHEADKARAVLSRMATELGMAAKVLRASSECGSCQ